MIKKSFITDCEGPLTLNDNAYEISSKFIDNGDELFKIISKYDDYLVDEIKKPNYHAGDTLKLIAPFFKAYGLKNKDIIDFSKSNISLVNGVIKTLKFADFNISSFIISTSYGQYIEALCNLINFPLENTYYTKLDLDSFNLAEDEKEKLIEFKDIILNGDFNDLERIFFEEIPKMSIGKLIKNVKTVGGTGKKLAMEDLLKKHDLDASGVMYVGDSITDTEPLKFARENNGLSVSFNGNEYSLKEAEIAIISDNTIATSLLIDLHSKFNKEYVLKFIKSYSKDPKRAFESFRIGFSLIDDFNQIFKDKNLPIIEIITKDNIEDLTKKSIEMRKTIRGKNIGALG
ncbi:MAG: hypothetical protein LBU74_06260 [Methanobacteriaceae archaeon]|nr:hypothetical protein [Candidatus Methanorudis spinitermitis]